ncbi:PilZ domain-containing protein [Herminiimonas aquatilis]|uniref:PilZ domain-containing protein n=1 Tax=Herminiimonas aquatilis TaxID=345342 RepID=A0ABW2J5Q1_9BURK|nr:PilZ domain-containing protein [Janthinobacterium sp. Marseille]
MVVEHKSPRHIFRRRAVMTSDTVTLHVRTLDVSEHGFGVIAKEPVRVGKTCSLVLNALVGEHVIQQTFACEIVYCILTGVDGFRIGLNINNAAIDSSKQHLRKIISSCSSPFS